MAPRNSQANPPANPSPSAGETHDDGFMSATSFIPDVVEDGINAEKEGTQTGGAPVDSPIAPEMIAQALRPTFETIFDAIAKARGPHWQLKEFEQSALVTGWTPILQILLAKLGSSEQVMLALAMTSTAAIVGGKIAQDVTSRGSSMASTKTPGSVASSAYSASATVANQPEPASSSEMLDAA